MDIQVISFALAIVVGVVCFGLVKYTADEFDRWYDQPGATVTTRVPAVIGTIATFAIVALLVAR